MAAAVFSLGGRVSVFSSAIASALKTIEAVAGVEVTYARGSTFVKLTAVQGRTDFHLDDGSGNVITFRSTDFLFDAADLVLSDVIVTPIQGDTISIVVGKVIHTYE